MKHVLSIKIVTALMMALVPLLLWADNSISYTATYDYSKLTLGTDTLGGVTYTTVSYDGLYNDGEPGVPSLPVDVIRFSVPYNAVNFSVSTKLSNTTTTRIDHMVYPCQLPRMMNDTTPVVITWPDSAAYAPDPDPLHPSPRAWVTDEGFLAGENHIVTVAVLPIANYHSDNGLVRNAIKKSSTVRLTISYELTDPSNVNCLVRNNDSLRQEGYALTRRMVVNGESVEAYAPHNVTIYNYPIIEGGTEEEIDSTNCSYLIVTTSELQHSVRRIAALKRQKGYGVKVVTLDEVVNDPYSRDGDIFMRGDTAYAAYDDDAGKLRQYLRRAFQSWDTKYVLLAGKDIPFRSVDGYYNENGRQIKINGHGDLYFSELDSDWNDSIDCHPDLIVGRLLGKTSDQFNAYSDKLYRYELNPGHGDYSYLRNALYTDDIEFTQSTFHGLTEFKSNLDSIFVNGIQLTCDSIHDYPKGNDVLDSINVNHPAFMASFNHGDASCIKTCENSISNNKYWLWAIDTIKTYQFINDTLETGNGLNRMSNKNYPMVYYSLSCRTIPYNRIPEAPVDINYGESFTMGKDYGGPVYMGNTRTIEMFYAAMLAYKYEEQLNNNEYILGIADAKSKMDYQYRYKKAIAVYHNYLGDPTVEMWTNTPQQYSNISISRTNDAIIVSGISNADSTIVAYADNSGNVRKQLASSSTTFNNASPNASIMLYKHNYIPYIAPLLLQNYNIAQSQYVIASDVTAGNSVDSDSGRTSGDVTITSGVEYEIEASGTVRLEGGFNVEKGATFVVNPSCF